MFCCALLYVHFSFAIILMGKRELVALFCSSSWCLVIFVSLPHDAWVCLQFVIVVFPDYTYYFSRRGPFVHEVCDSGIFRSYFKSFC